MAFLPLCKMACRMMVIEGLALTKQLRFVGRDGAYEYLVPREGKWMTLYMNPQASEGATSSSNRLRHLVLQNKQVNQIVLRVYTTYLGTGYLLLTSLLH